MHIVVYANHGSYDIEEYLGYYLEDYFREQFETEERYVAWLTAVAALQKHCDEYPSTAPPVQYSIDTLIGTFVTECERAIEYLLLDEGEYAREQRIKYLRYEKQYSDPWDRMPNTWSYAVHV